MTTPKAKKKKILIKITLKFYFDNQLQFNEFQTNTKLRITKILL